MRSKILATIAFATSIALASASAFANDNTPARGILWLTDPEYAMANNAPLEQRSTTIAETSLVPRADDQDKKFTAPRRHPQRPQPKNTTPAHLGGGCSRISGGKAVRSFKATLPCAATGAIQNLATPNGGQVKLQCNREANSLRVNAQNSSPCDVDIGFPGLVEGPNPPRRGETPKPVAVLHIGGTPKAARVSGQQCSVEGISDEGTPQTIQVEVSLLQYGC